MFYDKLRAATRRNKSFLCVGIDPDASAAGGRHLPSLLQAIIEETLDLVCAYKPNLAFFEALGPSGMNLLLESLAPIPRAIPVIADAKRGDIGNTARFYAKALFEAYDFDAATVNPYGGGDAVEPFLEYVDRGVFVWCHSSNPGAADLQERALADGRLVYEAVAELARSWNSRGNVGLVVGATYPEELARVRRICPEMPILVPGVGAQEGELAAAVRAAADAQGQGFIINASRQVLYASTGKDFAKAARRQAQALRDEINRQREAILAGLPQRQAGLR